MLPLRLALVAGLGAAAVVAAPTAAFAVPEPGPDASGTRVAVFAPIADIAPLPVSVIAPISAAAPATAPADTPLASLASLASIAPVAAPSDVQFGFVAPAVEVRPAAPEPAAAAARASSSGGDYSFHVGLTGHQAALDLCAGWVFEDFRAGDVVSAHNHCGGDVVLGMNVGDTVSLTGHVGGTYRVTETKRVSKGVPASVLAGGLWMQTCYYDDVTMRLVRLTPA